MIRPIFAQNAPAALGPYSPAIEANGLLFLSGQTPINPQTGRLVNGSIREQTQQALQNLSNVLEAAGSDLSKVVKTTVFLKDMNDFEEMNAAYSDFFPHTKPARTTVEVARLPKDAAVEIELVALSGKS